MSPHIIFKYFNLITLLFSPCVFAAEQPVIEQVLTLKAATDLAVQDSPDLAQIQARSQAMAAIPSQMGTLPDPEISFNAMSLPVNTFNVKQEDMTQLGAGISQAIPFPDKFSLREQAAAFEAEAATQNISEVRWQLLSEVKTTWWLIFYLDRAIQIARTKYDILVLILTFLCLFLSYPPTKVPPKADPPLGRRILLIYRFCTLLMPRH